MAEQEHDATITTTVGLQQHGIIAALVGRINVTQGTCPVGQYHLEFFARKHKATHWSPETKN
jgi:hypothetical protein